MENSKSDYALVFASQSILRILTRDHRNISNEALLNLRNFVLKALAADPDLSKFMTRSLIHVLCKITKLGWCNDPKMRSLVEEIVQFLQAGTNFALLGLRLLTELVTEFDPGHLKVDISTVSSNRRASQTFREHGSLTRAFRLALDSLQMAAQQPNLEGRTILKEALRTLYTCLNYDFIGVGSDDDHISCINIPSTWVSYLMFRVISILHRLFLI